MSKELEERLRLAARDLRRSPEARPARTTPLAVQKSRRRKILLASAFLVGTLAITSWGFTQRPSKPVVVSIVPANVQHAVPFDIYYPDPARLPAGYTLDKRSFSATAQTVVYSVSNQVSNTKLAFSVQRKPSSDDLKTFYEHQLPLRLEVATDVGTASIGVLNNQTLASIPTKGNAWVLVTAAKDIDPEIFNQVLKTLRK